MKLKRSDQTKKAKTKPSKLKKKGTRPSIKKAKQQDDSEIGSDSDLDYESINDSKPQKKSLKEYPKKGKKTQEKADVSSESDLSDEEGKEDLKKHLANLKNSDPEFYKYLEEHDKNLLDFGDSESDSDTEKEKSEKYHVPPTALEVASDESDYEPDGPEVEKAPSNVITLKMIEKWQQDLKTDKTRTTLKEVVDAFHAALLQVSGENNVPSRYRVNGSSVFNAIIRMCVLDVPVALRLLLNMPVNSRDRPKKSRQWASIRKTVELYLGDLYELCAVTSPSMLRVLLKHLHQMVSFLVFFPRITLKFLKRVVNLWSSEEDVIRVLAFLCALRIVNLEKKFLEPAVKSMYMTYVKNTKFISPSTLPGVNFMRKSLAEMFALSDAVTYRHAFLYIRQLAIHLRNAVTLKKKESYQAVYNWQYVSSLNLWAELLGIINTNSQLQSLVYPLVQIIVGTIKLIPAAQYFPLRFYCCKILIELSAKTGVFIPVIPFLTEVLRDFNFDKKHSKVSMKPMDFTCILRCSKSQMAENGFKDAVIENIYNLLIEYVVTESHRLNFPDTLVPAVIQMKQFIKDCKNQNYIKKIRSVLEKITENSQFIENERKKVTIKLDDTQAIEAIEMSLKNRGTPFQKFYNDWEKIQKLQLARKVTNNEAIGDYKLPVIYKFDKKRSRDEASSVGPPELFPSDDEDDNNAFLNGLTDDGDKEAEDSDEEPKPKKTKKIKVANGVDKKSKRKGKEKKAPTPKKKAKVARDEDGSDVDDIVQDLSLQDFE